MLFYVFTLPTVCKAFWNTIVKYVQSMLERIHPLQFESLWGKFGADIVVILHVRWDEHRDGSSSHEHFNIFSLCGEIWWKKYILRKY